MYHVSVKLDINTECWFIIAFQKVKIVPKAHPGNTRFNIRLSLCKFVSEGQVVVKVFSLTSSGRVLPNIVYKT